VTPAFVGRADLDLAGTSGFELECNERTRAVADAGAHALLPRLPWVNTLCYDQSADRCCAVSMGRSGASG